MMLGSHKHGKGEVRVARRHVCPKSGNEYFAEYVCNVEIGGHTGRMGSDKSFLEGDNCGVVATDTCKNHAYILAKEVDWKTFYTPELFAIAYAEKFLNTYDFLPWAEVSVSKKPWVRVTMSTGQSHSHAFQPGPENERWTATAKAVRGKSTTVVSGISGLVCLKTKQSGFYGFHRDKHASLPETKMRMVASAVTATWTYSAVGKALKALPFNEIGRIVRTLFVEEFAGNPVEGTYSNSVQHTLYLMACAALKARSEIKDMSLYLPNIHYIPAPALKNTGIYKFEDDVFLPTSEPFGTIKVC